MKANAADTVRRLAGELSAIRETSVVLARGIAKVLDERGNLTPRDKGFRSAKSAAMLPEAHSIAPFTRSAARWA